MAIKKVAVPEIIRIWLPLAVAVTLLCGLMYLTIQQYIRLSANDIPTQLAEDAKAAIDSGRSPEDVIPANLVNISQSLSPFVIVFDGQGEPVASSAQLNGKTPAPPPGIFNNVQAHGVEKFSWEPSPGVRSAAVVVRGTHGYVLAAQSLRETEKHEAQLLNEITAGWIITLLVTLGVAALIKSKR